MHGICRRCSLTVTTVVVFLALPPFVRIVTGQEPKSASKKLAIVNGKSITERDLQVMMAFREVPKTLHKSVRKIFLQRLIDNRLMREFVKQRKVTVPKDLLDRAVKRVHDRIRRMGRDPAQELKRSGLTEALLRHELALPIAWNLYARKIISGAEIRKRFRQRRPEFDGTRVRARQIVLKLPKDAVEKRKAVKTLNGIRGDILAGKTTFAAAAMRYSTAPSKTMGGDIGEFAFHGEMPLDITRVAFSLKEKEIGKAFVTQFGVHLLQVTRLIPGQLSLEDARPEIFRQIATERWNKQVAALRKSAKIEIPR